MVLAPRNRSRRRRPGVARSLGWLSLVVAGVAVCAVPALPKDKGLPSSPQRDAYCEARLRQCYGDVAKDCRDTYDRVDHRADCVTTGNRGCGDLFGERSSCRTAPRVLEGTDAALPGAAGSISEPRDPSPPRTAPRPGTGVVR